MVLKKKLQIAASFCFYSGEKLFKKSFSPNPSSKTFIKSF